MIDWEKMIAAATNVCNPRKLSASSYAGSVGAALMSDSGKIYTGVCIDTPARWASARNTPPLPRW